LTCFAENSQTLEELDLVFHS
jgi:hypothetical protein